jgi:hypothetical protein
VLLVADGGNMAESQKSTILGCHGTAILHKLAMAFVKRFAAAVFQGIAMANALIFQLLIFYRYLECLQASHSSIIYSFF